MSTAPTIVSTKRTLRSEVNPNAHNLIAIGILTEEKLDTESSKLPTQGASDLVASFGSAHVCAGYE